MKRCVITVAVVIAGLMLAAVPAAAQGGRGSVGSDEWNLFVTNVLV